MSFFTAQCAWTETYEYHNFDHQTILSAGLHQGNLYTGREVWAGAGAATLLHLRKVRRRPQREDKGMVFRNIDGESHENWVPGRGWKVGSQGLTSPGKALHIEPVSKDGRYHSVLWEVDFTLLELLAMSALKRRKKRSPGFL